MGANNGIAVRTGFIQGQRVSYLDQLREQSANRSQIGKGVAAQQGSPNALPLASATIAPLAVTTNGTMVVSIGGNGQTVLVDGWLSDGCPSQTFTVPNNTSGSARKDLIAIAYVIVDDGTESIIDESSSGTQTSESGNLVADGVQYMYVQGDSTGNAPAAPSGYDAFATIAVASGATAINGPQIAYLFPIMNPQGSTGLTGATGAMGPSPNPRGAWSNTATYNPLDIVTYAGSSFIVPLGAEPAVGTIPTGSPSWVLLTPPGPAGSAGTNGTNGINGTNGTNGINGTVGPQGPTPETTTTLATAIPAVGSSGTFPVSRPDGLPFGSWCIVSDGSKAFYGQVTRGGSPLGITCLQQIAGATGTLLASGAIIAPAGPPGAQGLSGAAAPSGNLIFGGESITSDGGYFTVSVPYGVTGAAAIVKTNSGDYRPIEVHVDQQQSSFSDGLVVFMAVEVLTAAEGDDTGQLLAQGGVGFMWLVSTNLNPVN